MLTPGPSTMPTPIVSASVPMARPISSIRSTFHVAPSAEAVGKQVAGMLSVPSEPVFGHAAHAVRAVRHKEVGHAQALNRRGRPRTGPDAQAGFFFQRHLRHGGGDIERHDFLL